MGWEGSGMGEGRVGWEGSGGGGKWGGRRKAGMPRKLLFELHSESSNHLMAALTPKEALHCKFVLGHFQI